MLGGGVLRHEWWKFYREIDDTRYKRIFITADTACKTKEWNDYTAIGVWGVTIGNKLRLLDMVHGKFEINVLRDTLLAVWDKWKMGVGMCRCTELVIEDKASGMQAIQDLKRIGGLPIRPYVPEKDKYQRVEDILPQIAAGNVELPVNDQHPISHELIAEADAFSADLSHLHDDMIDMTVMAVDRAFVKRGYF
jgi:predicted phage terminase large subunit-like protein